MNILEYHCQDSCHVIWHEGERRCRLPRGASGKPPRANSEDIRDVDLIPGLGKSPGEPTPVFLPGETLGQRSLVGYSP